MALLPIKTRKAIQARLVDFPASAARAQLINILGYKLEDGETIADRFDRDHVHTVHAQRNALLLVDAGAAKLERITKKVHCGNGIFKEKEVGSKIIFEDGSSL